MIPRDRRRRRLRLVLLVVVPCIAALTGFWLYLSGGRYVTTDNAYVGAQKVLITADISGEIDAVSVVEGQPVKAGDPLYTIRAATFRSAEKEAEARLAAARSDYLGLKATLAGLKEQKAFATKVLEARREQRDRKKKLVARGVTAEDAMDDWDVTVATAAAQLASLEQQESQALARLLGAADLPLEQFPAYMEAAAQLESARRDLSNTDVRAPIGGIATLVSNIQVGRYITAGTPVLAVISDAEPWVDANLKETDLTHVAPGQAVTIVVDTWPDRVWHGRVASISPGTGAQFSILPPQNASGNWVKVVQRVPVRIVFDEGGDLSQLRAGLSAYVSIDTKRQRTFAGLLGFGSSRAALPAMSARTSPAEQ
ncbi:MAG: HlyD family secretion protein [Hyphomicrobiaceae bacterium]